MGKIKFIESPKRYFYLALSVGFLIAYFMVFVEPFDTQQHNSWYTSIKLAGYGATVALCLMLNYWIERRWYLNSGKVWHYNNEICSMLMLLALIATFTNLYHAIMFGAQQKTIIEFALFAVHFVLPLSVVLLPVVILLRQHFGSSST